MKNTLDKIGNIIGVLFFIVFLLLVIKAFDWGFLKGEITEYPVQCTHKLNYGGCNEPQFTLNKTTYKVLPDRQEVLYWNEASGTVEKLSKCAVKNRKNWSCSYNDDSATFGFTDGRYWSYTNQSMASDVGIEFDAKTYYVSKWDWLKLKCRDSGTEGFLCLPLMILVE